LRRNLNSSRRPAPGPCRAHPPPHRPPKPCAFRASARGGRAGPGPCRRRPTPTLCPADKMGLKERASKRRAAPASSGRRAACAIVKRWLREANKSCGGLSRAHHRAKAPPVHQIHACPASKCRQPSVARPCALRAALANANCTCMIARAV
jgi:hypothetical protein